MTDHCNPESYITREEHIEQCNNRMAWAKEVIEASKEDRGRLWDETEKIVTSPANDCTSLSIFSVSSQIGREHV